MFWWNKRTVRKEKGREVKGEVEGCVKEMGEVKQEKRDGKQSAKRGQVTCFDILLLPSGTKHVSALWLLFLLLGDETPVAVNEI